MAGEQRVGFAARTSVAASEFGIRFHPIMGTGGAVVSDKLDVHIEVEGILQQPEA